MPLRRGEDSLRLVIADDDSLAARRTRASVDGQGNVEVVGIAASGHDAARLAGELAPNVVVMGGARRGRASDPLALMDVILAVAELSAFAG